MTHTSEVEDLYRSEHRRLEAQIARRTGNSHSARDLVHDVFLRLWDKAERLTITPAYLSVSARNAAIDHLRSEQVKREFVNQVVPEQFAAQSVTPLQHLEARDSARLIDNVLRQLPDRTRHIYLLHNVYGKNYREISFAVGISISAVEKHIAKALLAMRSALK